MIEKTTIISVGTIASLGSGTVSFQWDTPFPDGNYATGITIESNSRVPTDPLDKGLKLVSQNKRPDGMDITLSNPHPVDQTSDRIDVWAGWVSGVQ